MARKPATTIDILGTRYRVYRQRIYSPRSICTEDEECAGFCENPRLYLRRPKEILISSKLRGRELCDTICHEALHALDFEKNEEWVEHGGNVISELLFTPPFDELIWEHA